MSFPFGKSTTQPSNPQPTFGFVQQQQPQQQSGFSFGQGNQNQQPQTQGFSFGAPSMQSGFSFGNAAPSGFSFGSTPAATTASTTSTFGFGSMTPATNTGTPSNTMFGGIATTSSTGFNFGAPATSSNFSFGSLPATTSAPATGFGFGSPNINTSIVTQSFPTSLGNTSQVGSNFSMNAPRSISSPFGTASGFSFGGTPSTIANTSFTLGADATNATSGSTVIQPFGFGTPSTAAVSATPVATTSSFSFPGMGTAPTFATPATNVSANSIFGTPTTLQLTTNQTGFGFGLPQTTQSSEAKQKSVSFDLSASSQSTLAQGSGFIAISTPNTDTQSQPKIAGFAPMATTTATGFFSVPSSTAATGFTFGVAPAATATTPSVIATAAVTGTILPSLQQQQQKSAETVATAGVIATTIPGTSAFNMSGTSMFSMPSPSSTTTTTTMSPFSITPLTSTTQFAITTVPSFSTTMSFPTVSTTTGPSLFSSAIVSAPASLPLTTPTITTTTIAAAATTTTSIPLTTPISSMTFVTSTATIPSATTMPSTIFSVVPTIASTATTTTTTSLSLFPTVPKISPVTATAAITFGGITSTSATMPVTTVASLTTATTVTSSTVTQTPVMNFRQLEEAINKWNLELEEQERIFLNQATEVNAWDCLLISNGEKITSLYEAVEYVKVNQQRLDHELDFIVAQQRELEEILTPLEKSVEGLPNLSVQQHADLEREHTYHLAENIDTQLKRMAEDIKEIIEHINSRNNNKDENDPIHQIAKILNSHMDALQWIEQNTVVVQRKLEEISKTMENKKSDKDKSVIAGYRK